MIYYCKLIEEGGAITAEFPDLPNVITWGKDQDEALYNAWEALNAALESDTSRGLPLPETQVYNLSDLFPIDVETHILVAWELRKLRGELPQSEIAKRLHLSYHAYQGLENPVKGNPTVKTLEKVARALGKRLQVTLI